MYLKCSNLAMEFLQRDPFLTFQSLEGTLLNEYE
jgi:hypothetical protein